MPALVAIDPRETFVEVAAVEKSFQGILLNCAANGSRRSQLIRVSADALIERTLAGLPWAVDPAGGIGAGLHAACPSVDLWAYTGNIEGLST